MRVVLDARHASFAGIGRFTVELWSALRLQEPEASAFVRRSAEGGWIGSPSQLISPPTRSVRSPPFVPTEQVELPMALRAARAAVYHSPHFAMPFLTRVPVVITIHDLFPYHDARHARSPATRAYYRSVLPRAVRHADRVVAVSRHTYDDVQRTFGVGDDRLRLVRHGLNHARWRRPPDSELAAVRDRYRLPDAYVLHVGAAKWHKNLRTVLAALDASTPTLVCAGPTLNEIAEHANVRDSLGEVRALGRVADSDLPALYADAVAVVVPSLYEAVSLPALEAMAVGTPVLASHASALPETVGEAGLLLDPSDPGEWRGALQRIAADSELRSQLVAAGKARVADRDWSRCAAEYRAVYGELA